MKTKELRGATNRKLRTEKKIKGMYGVAENVTQALAAPNTGDKGQPVCRAS